MIARLKGIIDTIDIGNAALIIDVGGIGYFVFVTKKILSDLKEGDFVDLYIHHIFRQENQYLCGFRNANEVRIFKILLDIHGLGVKSSMSLLTSLSLEELATAVAIQDADMLCKANGIGKKMAERILLELKDKTFIKLDTNNIENTNKNISDAVLGLISLGYQKSVVTKVINKVSEDLGSEATVNELIVSCLQNM